MAVCTVGFVDLGRKLGEAEGLADLKIVTMPAWYSSSSVAGDEELGGAVEAVIKAVVEAVTGQGAKEWAPST
ncbi:MAG: hypothetical protein HYX92_16885 [Chloroflexi bacterium]|nr:hypothetical protein [Chloroflexota bacterium]